MTRRSEAYGLSTDSPIGAEPLWGAPNAAGRLSTESPIGAEPTWGGPNTAGRFDEAGAWIWPQTVRDAKNRIDGAMAITAADVHNCTALSATDKAAFAQFHADWRKFFCQNETGDCATPDVSIWGLGSQMDQCDSFQTQLSQWQDKVTAAGCHTSGPALPAPPAGPDLSPIKWIAIAAAIGAGLWVANQTGLPRFFPRTKGR